MDVVKALPPNYDAIAARFNLVAFPAATFFFCFGDRIYTDKPNLVTPAILAHEEVHSRRQARHGNVLDWWERYLADDHFRLIEEVASHKAELAWHEKNSPRALLRQARHIIVSKLSHPIYGPMVDRHGAKKYLGLLK